MKEKKDALLLTAAVCLGIWLILFITAVTEPVQDISRRFTLVSIIFATAGVMCSVSWITIDTLQKRPWVSGNRKYRRLKRHVRDQLAEISGENFIEKARDEIPIYNAFLLKGEQIGVDRQTLVDDFERLRK